MKDRAAELREDMVREQIEARGVRDPRVLDAMRRVPRHLFAGDLSLEEAYADHARAIGHRQTISQPYIVALMTEMAELTEDERVLEIGTGSGYQAAVLAEIAGEVYTIEIVEPLAASARAALDDAGYQRVHSRAGDGYQGWPEAAPFDAILITAAAPRVPQPLLDQLTIGGRLVLPVDVPDAEQPFGRRAQRLEVHERTEDGFSVTVGLPVLFVPMTGAVREN